MKNDPPLKPHYRTPRTYKIEKARAFRNHLNIKVAFDFPKKQFAEEKIRQKRAKMKKIDYYSTFNTY